MRTFFYSVVLVSTTQQRFLLVDSILAGDAFSTCARFGFGLSKNTRYMRSMRDNGKKYIRVLDKEKMHCSYPLHDISFNVWDWDVALNVVVNVYGGWVLSCRRRVYPKCCVVRKGETANDLECRRIHFNLSFPLPAIR